MKTKYNTLCEAVRENIKLDCYAQLNYYSRAEVKKKTCSDLQRWRVLANHRLTKETGNIFLSTKEGCISGAWDARSSGKQNNRQYIAESK